MQIKPYGQVVKEAAAELKQYQSGEKLLINTRFPWLEGLKPGDIVLLGGPSFTGKTYLLNDIKDDVMNIDLNPAADKFIWLSNSLEMTNLNNLIRDFAKLLSKSKKDILTQHFNDMEKDMVNRQVAEKSDGRYFINEESFTPAEFNIEIRKFLDQHKKAECVFIDMDHIRLIKGSNKKAAIDELLEIQNVLKKEYPNVVFIDLSQFNRNIKERGEDKSEKARVQSLDFSDSDAPFTYADFVIGINMPISSGIDQYRLVSPKFYSYLTEHFGDINTKGTKVSFKTHARIFYEVLKSRFVDGFNAKNLFITQLEADIEEEAPAAKTKPKFKEDTITLPFNK